MPTEGLSEENRALLDRVWGPALLVGFDATGPAILTPHGLNRLLDAARAEGPAPGTTTYSEPELQKADRQVITAADDWHGVSPSKLFTAVEALLAALIKGADHG